MIEKQIADKIKFIRKGKKMTLAQLGEATGLSKGLLSRIENNQVSPPIATLSKIAQGLEVSISVFFEDLSDEQNRYTVTRKNDRLRVTRAGSKMGFDYYSLTRLKSNHVINPFIVRYPVLTQEPTYLYDHPGEEFFMVLKGEADFVYGKETIRLSEGDAIHFDPSVPHRGQNAGAVDCECLVIIVGEYS